MSTMSLHNHFLKIFKTISFLFLLSLPLIVWSSNDARDPNRQLFNNTEPIRLVIQMDMESVLNDESEDPEYRPAFLVANSSEQNVQSFMIKIKARGKTRRISEVCEFPPLKINFKKKSTVNTIFEGQDKVKMVTHCRGSKTFQNYAMLEYLAYKTYNILTDYSYRVRLVEVVYQDTEQNYPDIQKSGFIIEDDKLLAERFKGSITSERIFSQDSCEQQTLDVFAMFQFMIGNTDWWIHTRHNVDILKLEDKELIPLPFDFDYAGMINAPYAIPSKELPIADVKDRFFKGSCKSAELYSTSIDLFNQKKNEIIHVIQTAEFLDNKYKKNSIRYIGEFYRIINDPTEFSEYLNQPCDLAKGKFSAQATRIN